MTCEHKRRAGLTAKCSDLCFVEMGEREHDGYVPDDMGIGGGDYVGFTWCLDCGQIIGKWPVPPCKLEGAS